MREDFKKRQEKSRNELIKARASLDALEYISLMRRKSPESLNPGPNGRLVINAVDGESILEKAREYLNLDVEGMLIYFGELAIAIENFLKN